MTFRFGLLQFHARGHRGRDRMVVEFTSCKPFIFPWYSQIKVTAISGKMVSMLTLSEVYPEFELVRVNL